MIRRFQGRKTPISEFSHIKTDLAKKEQKLTTLNFKEQKSKFELEVNEIVTAKVDVMDITTAEIINEVNTTVTTHLESEPMKQIISSHALESFTKVSDSKALDIIKRIEDTAEDIMTEDGWIKQHIEEITMDAVMYQKDYLQDHINKIINSSSSYRLIKSLAKTACNRHAAMATQDFADVTDEYFDNNNDDNESDNQGDIERKKTKNMFTQARKQADEFVEEEKDATELVEEKSLQQKHDFLISKNITKFEVKPMI